MQNVIDDLIKFQSLQGNTINSLTHILDNSKIMGPGSFNDSLISGINQLEVNNDYFKEILAKM